MREHRGLGAAEKFSSCTFPESLPLRFCAVRAGKLEHATSRMPNLLTFYRNIRCVDLSITTATITSFLVFGCHVESRTGYDPVSPECRSGALTSLTTCSHLHPGWKQIFRPCFLQGLFIFISKNLFDLFKLILEWTSNISRFK